MFYTISDPLINLKCDSKHAILSIIINIRAVCTQCINENDTVCLGCQYTDFYSHLKCYTCMFIEIIIEFRQNLIE